MSMVLGDALGPRGRRRAVVASGLASAVLLGLLLVALRRFSASGQLDLAKWSLLVKPGALRFLLGGLVNTLRAAALALIVAVAAGTLLALGRLSRRLPVRLAAVSPAMTAAPRSGGGVCRSGPRGVPARTGVRTGGFTRTRGCRPARRETRRWTATGSRRLSRLLSLRPSGLVSCLRRQIPDSTTLPACLKPSSWHRRQRPPRPGPRHR